MYLVLQLAARSYSLSGVKTNDVEYIEHFMYELCKSALVKRNLTLAVRQCQASLSDYRLASADVTGWQPAG